MLSKDLKEYIVFVNVGEPNWIEMYTEGHKVTSVYPKYITFKSYYIYCEMI